MEGLNIELTAIFDPPTPRKVFTYGRVGQLEAAGVSEYPKMTAHPDHPKLAVGIVDPPKLEIFGTWNGLPIYGSPMDHAWEPQFPTLADRMAADPTQDWT